MDPVHVRTMEGLQGGIENAMEIEPAEEIEEGPQLFIEREVVNLGVDVVVNAVRQDFTMDSMDNKELSMACGQKLDQRVNQIKRTVLNGRDLDIAYVVCTPAFDFEEIQEIFHVAMPEVAQGSQPTPTDEHLLRKCYLNCLIKLQYKKLTSIAFPLPQNYDWQQAAMVALLLVLEYFKKNPAFWKKIKQVSFYTENGDIYRGLKIAIVETDEMTLTEGNMARLKSRLEELLLEAKKAQVVTEPEEDIYEDPDVNFPKLHAVKGQIQLMEADILVNAANKELRPGDGVDKAIRTACGPQITKATSEIAKHLHLKILQPGQVVSTDSYKLKTAKRIYHTAGPIVPGGTLPTLDHKKHLEKCYANALVQAELDGLRSIAFPLLSVGIYNFELFEGIWIAVWTILRHFEKNERSKIKEVIIVNQSQRIIDKIGNLLGNTTAVLNPAQVPRFRKMLEKKRNQEFRCALRIAMKPNTYTTATVKAIKVPPPPIYKNYRRCLAIRDCPTVGVVLELLFLIWRKKVVDNVSSNCTMEALEDIFGRHPGSELVPRSMLLQIMPLSTESESASDYFFRLLQSLPFEFYEKFTFDVKVIQECEKCRTKSNTKSSLRFLTITETGSTFQETLKHVTYKKTSSNGRCTKCSKLRPFGNHQHILIPDQCEYLAVKVDLTEQNKKYRVPFPQPTVTYKETSWRLIAIIRQLDEEFGEYDIFRRMDGRDGWLHIHLTKTKVLDKNPQISNKALLVFKRNSPSK